MSRIVLAVAAGITALHLAFEGIQGNVAERPMFLPRVTPQTIVERLGKVLDLKVRHGGKSSMLLAC